LAIVWIGCGGVEELPPTAQPQITEMLRADLEETPHPADGGGRGWLVVEESDVPAVASQPGRWTIEYEAGPQGIETGGALYLQVSPFWGWSTPQVVNPNLPGYTEVTTTVEGIELEPTTIDQQLMAMTIGGRKLESGESIRITYGAGSALCRERVEILAGSRRRWRWTENCTAGLSLCPGGGRRRLAAAHSPSIDSATWRRSPIDGGSDRRGRQCGIECGW
jgi:hypothetical protein